MLSRPYIDCNITIRTYQQGDKSSRAQILKKASDYITHMRRKNQHHQQVSK